MCAPGTKEWRARRVWMLGLLAIAAHVLAGFMLLQFAFLSSGNESFVVGRQMCFCFTDDALFSLSAPFSHVVVFCAF